MKVAVIGGGISGLTTGYRLKKTGVEITLFESADSVGGNIRTESRDGFLLEYGPNSLLASRPLLDLVEDISLADQILLPKANAKRRFIVRDGRIQELPSSIITFATGNTFSLGARLRVLKEPFISSRSPEGETVAEFFRRRLGNEITDFAVDPFISGIYAGDPERLRMKHAFPKLHAYETAYGSILKGALFSPKDPNAKLPKDFPRSFTFRNGISTLINALRDALAECVRTGVSVEGIGLSGGTYTVNGENFSAIVVSTPASAAARIVRNLDETLAAKLNDIYYPPIAVVYTAFRSEQVGVDPAGFGFLVPKVERRNILGTLFTSSVFDGRAPEDVHFFTTFIGGSRNAGLCSNSDEELTRIAVADLRPLLDIDGDPIFTAVKKWGRSIPQYNVGYEDVPAAIGKFRESHPGIFLCSNFYKGISVGDCVKNATATAAEVSDFLQQDP